MGSFFPASRLITANCGGGKSRASLVSMRLVVWVNKTTVWVLFVPDVLSYVNKF